MQIPRLEKIVLNMGVGEASQDRKKIEAAVERDNFMSAEDAKEFGLIDKVETARANEEEVPSSDNGDSGDSG